MMRTLMIGLAMLVCLSVGAQQRRSAQRGGTRTTVQQSKQSGKTQTKQSGKTQAKQSGKTQGKQSAQQGKQQRGGKRGKGGKKGAKTQTYTTDEIKGLQSQRTKIQQEIKAQQGKLQANQADVAQRLQNLMVINSEIDDKQKAIEGYETEIKGIDSNIDILRSQVSTLQRQLDERKEKYVKSMRYMGKYRTIQDKLMFIFSAKSLTQAYRRLRFVREYAAYQRAQGEQIKQKQEELNQKNHQLQQAKGAKNQLLSKGKAAQRDLQTKQGEQQKAVDGLKREQKSIQGLIAEQQKKDAQLNAEIDRLVAIEVEKARKRAEAERKAAEEARKKAAAEAARKKAEEARKRAEAEAAAREAERRIAAARAEEAARKKAAEEAARAAREAERVPPRNVVPLLKRSVVLPPRLRLLTVAVLNVNRRRRGNNSWRLSVNSVRWSRPLPQPVRLPVRPRRRVRRRSARLLRSVSVRSVLNALNARLWKRASRWCPRPTVASVAVSRATKDGCLCLPADASSAISDNIMWRA